MTGGVEVEDVAIPLDRGSRLRVLVRIYRAAPVPCPVVLYLPRTADVESTDTLARRLAVRVPAAVVTREPTLGLGQPWAQGHVKVVRRWLVEEGQRRGLDGANPVLIEELIDAEERFEAAVAAASAALVQGKGQGISG